MTIRQVEIDQSAVLELWPTQGPPSTATVEIRTSANAELAAATAAVIDPTVGAIAAASARDKTIDIVVSAGSIAAGETYWLESDGGRVWPIEIVSWDGATATLAEAMRHDIDGGTLLGGRVTYTLDDANTGTVRRDNRVIWRYTADGRARMEQYLLDIVNWPFALPITVADIRKVVPHWSDTSDSFDDLRSHVERELFDRVASAKLFPDLVYDRQDLLTAAVYRVLQLRYAAEPDTAAEWRALYEQAYAQFMSAKKWYDADEDLAKSTGTALATAGGDEYGLEGGEDFTPIEYMPVG